MRRSPLVLLTPSIALLASLLPLACGPSMGSRGPARSPLATQWLDRAKASYRSGDFEDARDAAAHALAAAPSDAEAREIVARIALVRLDFPEVIKLTEGLDSSEARGLARASVLVLGRPRARRRRARGAAHGPAGEGPLGARGRGTRSSRRGPAPVRDGRGRGGGGRDAPSDRPRSARRSERRPVRARRRADPRAGRDGVERAAARLELAPRARVGQPAIRSRSR